MNTCFEPCISKHREHFLLRPSALPDAPHAGCCSAFSGLPFAFRRRASLPAPRLSLTPGHGTAAGRAPAPGTDGAARPPLPALGDPHRHPRPPLPRAPESAATLPLPGTGRTAERNRTSPSPAPAAPHPARLRSAAPPRPAERGLPHSPPDPARLGAAPHAATSAPAVWALRLGPPSQRTPARPEPPPPPRAVALPGRAASAGRREGDGAARQELLGGAAEGEWAPVPQELGRCGGGCDVIEGKTPPRAKPTRCGCCRTSARGGGPGSAQPHLRRREARRRCRPDTHRRGLSPGPAARRCRDPAGPARRCRPPGATCPARQPRPGPPGRSEFKAPRGDEPRFPPHSHGPAGAAPRRLCRRLSPPLARRPRAVAARGSAAGPGAVVRPTPGRLPPACPVPGRAGVRMTPLPNGAGALPGRSISI